MRSGFFVQAYKAKGTRLLGQPSRAHAYADGALAEGARLAPWRAGVVVFRQAVDEEGVARGAPVLLSVHGRVPEGWLAAARVAA